MVQCHCHTLACPLAVPDPVGVAPSVPTPLIITRARPWALQGREAEAEAEGEGEIIIIRGVLCASPLSVHLSRVWCLGCATHDTDGTRARGKLPLKRPCECWNATPNTVCAYHMLLVRNQLDVILRYSQASGHRFNLYRMRGALAAPCLQLRTMARGAISSAVRCVEKSARSCRG